jgi:hypothetical protein
LDVGGKEERYCWANKGWHFPEHHLGHLIDFYKFQTICLPVAQRDSFFNSSNLCLRQQDHPLPSASSTDFKEDEEESLAFRLAGGGFFRSTAFRGSAFRETCCSKIPFKGLLGDAWMRRGSTGRLGWGWAWLVFHVPRQSWS